VSRSPTRRVRNATAYGLSLLSDRIAPPPLPEPPRDPADYTTTAGPAEVPVQREAYFMALNTYVRDGDAVLDVGCGLGYGINLLAIKAAEVQGVDVDVRAIDYCRERLVGRNPRLSGLAAYDGTRLPFEDGRFDVITTIDVLEHVPEPEPFLRELLRVARRAVVVSTPNRRPEFTKPDGTPRNPWHLREWSRPELAEVLAPLGVTVEWHHVNGPWDGPHQLSPDVRPDTQTLTPALLV
jgi:SAM-dependent methyltransferase